MLMITRPCAVLWLTLGVACNAAIAQDNSQEPARITTDTADYCAQLELLLTEQASSVSGPPARDVQRLSDTGQQLCERGQIRVGIAHLRTALRIIHRAQAAKPDTPNGAP
jgi:hypothetical protein